MIINSVKEIENIANSVQPLVFTSGCFDLLHPGHVDFLSKSIEIARKKNPAAKLFVAIHSDKAIAKMKGKDRPIISELQRAFMLDSLRCVDYTYIWPGWENIIDLVDMLKPKFLATTQNKIRESDWESGWQQVAKRLEAELISIKIDLPISTSTILRKLERN